MNTQKNHSRPFSNQCAFHQCYYWFHSHYRIEPCCITKVLTSLDYSITLVFLSGRFTKRTGAKGLPVEQTAFHRDSRQWNPMPLRLQHQNGALHFLVCIYDFFPPLFSIVLDNNLLCSGQAKPNILKTLFITFGKGQTAKLTLQ